MIATSNGNTSATINKAGAEVGAVVTVSNEEGDPSLSYVDFSNANVTLTADAEYYGLGAETNMGNVLISAWNCTGTGSEPNSCDGPTASENSGPDGNVEIEATSTASIDATGIGLESQANLTLDANSDQVNSGNVLISSQSTQSITHPFTQTGAVVIASSGPTTVDAENWGIDLHGNLSVTSCTGCGGGGMVWPTVAGIPYWTSGTAWGGAYNSSTPIPFSYLPTGTGSSNVVAGGVITAGGPTGGATAIPIITYNAAGQLTTVTTATPTVATVQGGAANEILYQTATNTTGFITAAASCIIGTNGSSVPSCLATILATNLPSALSSSSSMGTSCTVNASSTVTGVCGANTNTLNDGSGNGAIAGKWAVANFKNTNITAYALATADSTSTEQPLIPSSWTSGHTFVPVWQPSGSALAPVTVDANTLAVSSASTATTAGSLSGTPTLCTTGQAPTGILSNGNATGCAALGGGTTTNALTAAATGGAAPGSTFNGSAAVTFDYHSFGAAALAAANSFTYGQTITSQAIGSVPLTLNGYSSGQTADLLDVYDYPGHTKQFYIQSNGNVQIPGNLSVGVEISGAYVEGGSFEGTGAATTSTSFQPAGGLNYITGNSSAYVFNSASTQSAASNTPSAINIYGTVQYAGTVTGTWTGGIVETEVFGVGSADTYNGSAPIITSMSSKPTINVNTGSPVGYCEICSLPTETSVGAGVTNYFIKHAASGGALSSPNYSVTEGGFESNVGTQSVGTKFTTTGCSISSTTGGATAGKFTLGANSCSAVITMNGATGLTATNGWSCHANDETTAAGNTLLYFSANSATTATLSVPATAGTTDVIDFACTAF